MSKKQENLTVRELLKCDQNLDPLNINTAEIKELSDAMPKDGNIDINNAEILATKYLRGADLCAELLAVATAYAQKTDSLKKKAYSIAALVNSDAYFTASNNGKRPDKITDKMRTLYADMDEDYLYATQKHDEALAFFKWVSGKYDSFNRMHYLLKKILERGYTQEKASNWERDVIGNNIEDNIDDNISKAREEGEDDQDYDLGY